MMILNLFTMFYQLTYSVMNMCLNIYISNLVLWSNSELGIEKQIWVILEKVFILG